MIEVKFWQNKERGTVHMTMKGHAGTAPKGEDLVCAAATMLAYTVAQAMQFLYESGQLAKKPKIRLVDGNATIVATPKEDTYAEALTVFWVAQCGIHVLAHNYPGAVRLGYLTM